MRKPSGKKDGAHPAIARPPDVRDPAELMALLESHTPGELEALRARIEERAYQLYEQRGRREGYDLEDWLEAERQILGYNQ